ncbi:MAG: hypothetical protein NVV74_15400 [Magnetospirillum sp.]|nr:hypothetical protein [Magnetospirillum sp.]
MKNAETALPVLADELSRSCNSLGELLAACDMCARQHRLTRDQRELLRERAEIAFRLRLAAAG